MKNTKRYHRIVLDKLRMSLEYINGGSGGNGRSTSNKYLRNYNTYNNTKFGNFVDLKNNYSLSVQDLNIGTNNQIISPSLNETKNAIDSHLSHMAKTKGETKIRSVEGIYKPKEILTQLEQAIRYYEIKKDLNFHLDQSYKFGCIFDKGWLFINPITKNIESLLPWMANILEAEYHYDKQHLTKGLVRYNDYPITLAIKNYGEELESYYGGADYCRLLELYFDTQEKSIELYINNKLVKTYPYAGDIPLLLNFAYEPLFGLRTTSMVDQTINIQRIINMLSGREVKKIRLSPSGKMLIPFDARVESSDISNEVGTIIRFQGENPPDYFDPPAGNTTDEQLIDMWSERLYNILGEDRKQSQSQGGSESSSGKAIATRMELTDNRFQSAIDHRNRMHETAVNLMFSVFKDEQEIMPESPFRGKYGWAEIAKMKDDLQFEYIITPDNNDLGKLQQMQALGIPPNDILQMMGVESVNEKLGEENAPQDQIDNMITKVIIGEPLEGYESINIAYDLFDERADVYIANLAKHPGSGMYIDRLNNLIDQIHQKGEEEGFYKIQEYAMAMMQPPMMQQQAGMEQPQEGDPSQAEDQQQANPEQQGAM
jgi:hypothetical protein